LPLQQLLYYQSVMIPLLSLSLSLSLFLFHELKRCSFVLFLFMVIQISELLS